MVSVTEVMKRNFISSLTMIDRIIDICPDGLWVAINGWFPFWQQIYHSLECVDYWFREDYTSVYDDKAPKVWNTVKRVSPGLDKNVRVFTDFLCKTELKQYLNCICQKTDAYFDRLDDSRLIAPIAEDDDNFTYLDVIDMQIRHVMYHAGHCICILRDRAGIEVEWVSHNER